MQTRTVFIVYFLAFLNNIECTSKNMEKIQVCLCIPFALPVMTTTRSIQSRLTNILICELFAFFPNLNIP